MLPHLLMMQMRRHRRRRFVRISTWNGRKVNSFFSRSLVLLREERRNSDNSRKKTETSPNAHNQAEDALDPRHSTHMLVGDAARMEHNHGNSRAPPFGNTFYPSWWRDQRHNRLNRHRRRCYHCCRGRRMIIISDLIISSHKEDQAWRNHQGHNTCNQGRIATIGCSIQRSW